MPGELDLDRPFVDDDDEDDLGGVAIEAKRFRTSTVSKRLLARDVR